MNTFIVLYEGTWTAIIARELPSPANRREHDDYLWELQNLICEDFVKQGFEGEFVVSDVIKVVNKNNIQSLGLSFTFSPGEEGEME